jgi:hypothetical protein
MNEPIIYNSTDFEENLYDFFTYMKYKGELFTGTVIIEGDKTADNVLGNKEVVEFKNGHTHGHYLEYHRSNGQLIYDGIYEDSRCLSEKGWYTDGRLRRDWDYSVSGKEWYEDGTLKEHWDGKNTTLWDRDGILVRKNDIWFYKNGQKFKERLADGTRLHFSSTGEVAVMNGTVDGGEYGFRSVVYYYDNVLTQFYEELFIDPYPAFCDYSGQYGRKEHIKDLFDWVVAIYNEDKVKANYIIDSLIYHPTQETREHASFLKRLIVEKESGSVDPKPDYWLKKRFNQIIIR